MRSGMCFGALLTLMLVGVMVALGNKQNQSRSDELMAELREPKLIDGMKAADVLQKIEEMVKLDASNEEAGCLLDAKYIRWNRCTIKYQQWLIRQRVQNQNTPLGIYLNELSLKYREKCATRYRWRLVGAAVDVNIDDSDTVKDYARFFNHLESDSDKKLFWREEIQFELHQSTLKTYLDAIIRRSQEEGRDDPENELKHAIMRLKGACEQYRNAFSDFLWILKIIERPTCIEDQYIQGLLTGTRVCLWLQFKNFNRQLSEHYKELEVGQRELVSKFTNLLRLSDEIWKDSSYQLPNDVMKESLSLLMVERNRYSQDIDEYHIAQGLINDLELACVAHLEKLEGFLWLFDKGIKTEEISRESFDMLKRVRICSVLSFVKKQKTNPHRHRPSLLSPSLT